MVVPHLSVICNKSGLNDQRYVGDPAISMKLIAHPINRMTSDEANAYMEVGVKGILDCESFVRHCADLYYKRTRSISSERRGLRNRNYSV